MEVGSHSFTLVVRDSDKERFKNLEVVTELLNASCGASCGSKRIEAKDGALFVLFDRECEQFEDAVVMTIQDVERIEGLTVASVGFGNWVSLSVASVLASIGKSNLSNFRIGKRGDGTFPSPLFADKGSQPLWSWSEMAAWLYKHGKVDQYVCDNAKTEEVINIALKLRDKELLEHALAVKEMLG